MKQHKRFFVQGVCDAAGAAQTRLCYLSICYVIYPKMHLLCTHASSRLGYAATHQGTCSSCHSQLDCICIRCCLNSLGMTHVNVHHPLHDSVCNMCSVSKCVQVTSFGTITGNVRASEVLLPVENAGHENLCTTIYGTNAIKQTLQADLRQVMMRKCMYQMLLNDTHSKKNSILKAARCLPKRSPYRMALNDTTRSASVIWKLTERMSSHSCT